MKPCVEVAERVGYAVKPNGVFRWRIPDFEALPSAPGRKVWQKFRLLGLDWEAGAYPGGCNLAEHQGSLCAHLSPDGVRQGIVSAQAAVGLLKRGATEATMLTSWSHEWKENEFVLWGTELMNRQRLLDQRHHWVHTDGSVVVEFRIEVKGALPDTSRRAGESSQTAARRAAATDFSALLDSQVHRYPLLCVPCAASQAGPLVSALQRRHTALR